MKLDAGIVSSLVIKLFLKITMRDVSPVLRKPIIRSNGIVIMSNRVLWMIPEFQYK